MFTAISIDMQMWGVCKICNIYLNILVRLLTFWRRCNYKFKVANKIIKNRLILST